MKQNYNNFMLTHLILGYLYSVLTTSVLRDGFSMPECTYSVRKETFDGPFISFAKVGDTVVHRWECKAPPNQSSVNNLQARYLNTMLR